MPPVAAALLDRSATLVQSEGYLPSTTWPVIHINGIVGIDPGPLADLASGCDRLRASNRAAASPSRVDDPSPFAQLAADLQKYVHGAIADTIVPPEAFGTGARWHAVDSIPRLHAPATLELCLLFLFHISGGLEAAWERVTKALLFPLASAQVRAQFDLVSIGPTHTAEPACVTSGCDQRG